MMTKFGNGHQRTDGYIQITSGPNKGKLLHRLIYEEVYGPIPKGYTIHHKDGDKTKQSFKPADIVDPSVDDPADFFVYGMNGKVSARNEVYAHRAKETIRVFNLNNARLTGIRVGIARSIAFFLEHNPSEEQIDEYLRDMEDKDCPSVCYGFLKKRMA